jgi:hypothetical protein
VPRELAVAAVQARRSGDAERGADHRGLQVVRDDSTRPPPKIDAVFDDATAMSALRQTGDASSKRAASRDPLTQVCADAARLRVLPCVSWSG